MANLSKIRRNLTPNAHYAPALALKPTRGLKCGTCNREACQKPGAVWLNSSTHAYYCTKCAGLLNQVAGERCEKPICTLDESAIPKRFMSEAEALGYQRGVTDEDRHKTLVDAALLLMDFERDWHWEND